MSSLWPALDLSAWSATCETLHAHTQILGKLAVALAPPEPQLQHAALRLHGLRLGRRAGSQRRGTASAGLVDRHGRDGYAAVDSSRRGYCYVP